MALIKLKAPAKKKIIANEKKWEDTYDNRPTMCLKSEEVPEIKDFKVGQMIKVLCDCVVESIRKADADEKFTAEVRIIAIGVEEETKI